MNNVENVTSFEYLDSIINNNGKCFKEVRSRLVIVMQILNNMKNRRHNTSKPNKSEYFENIIFPLATYGQKPYTSSCMKKIEDFEL